MVSGTDRVLLLFSTHQMSITEQIKGAAFEKPQGLPLHPFNGILVPVTTCTLPAKNPEEAEGPTNTLHPRPSSLVCCFSFKPPIFLDWVGYVDQMKHKCLPIQRLFPGPKHNFQYLSSPYH